MLDESIVIFFPIFQFGCFKAIFGFTFNILFLGVFKKGPPDAVNIILLTFFTSLFCNNFQIEKCSESIGIKFVLFFFNSKLIKFQPQIIDSLLAIKIFFVSGIIFKVGSRPFIPEMALTQNDTFFLIIESIFLIPK